MVNDSTPTSQPEVSGGKPEAQAVPPRGFVQAIKDLFRGGLSLVGA